MQQGYYTGFDEWGRCSARSLHHRAAAIVDAAIAGGITNCYYKGDGSKVVQEEVFRRTITPNHQPAAYTTAGAAATANAAAAATW